MPSRRSWSAAPELLALWIIVRYTDFGPRSVAGAIVHVVAAIGPATVLLPPALDAVDAIGIPAPTTSRCSASRSRCSSTPS